MRLALVGIGAVTSVGHEATRAAAAIRAGITRPAPLPISFPDEESGEDEPLLGHPLVGIADGFEPPALQAILGGIVARDLVSGDPASLVQERWAGAAVFACTSEYRSDDLSFVTDRMRETLAHDLVRAAGLAIPPERCFVVLDGQASVLAALTEAMRGIEERRFVRALVVGADSLVKEADVEWLASQGSLKTPDEPAGLEPGEGAGAILVEAEDEARRRGAKVLAWLEAVKIAQEPETRAEGKRGTGRGLAEAIRGALGSRKTVGTVFADLNGEDARAFEWGAALARLARTHDLPASPEAIATSIGDAGAASGAIQLVCATQALVRGYARGDACLVCSSADSGKVGAALLVAAGAEERR